ncbi:MAG: hypothetical protein PHN49_01975 [Candidatus Omnitrophica bacterium]|jgi:hypothetical protein|nr:hypothetical protein [Candidatus Omnitrophota bacterium]
MSNFGPSLFGPAVFGGEPVPHLFLQVDAELTTLARRYTARGHTDGTSLQQFTFFVVGQGGHDPLDYLAATPVNPDVINGLVDTVFLGNIAHIEWANTRSISFYCPLDAGDADGSYLSEIGIYATIANSPIPGEDGDILLYAVGHFPMLVRPVEVPGVSSGRVVLRVTVTT